jgi:hypoxanthine phosphoribosyltransferase
MKRVSEPTLKLSWKDVQQAVDKIAEQASKFQWDTVIAIMRGGMVPARMVAAKLGVKNIVIWDRKHGTLGRVEGHALVVDDIADSGATVKASKFAFGQPVAVIVSKVDFVDYVGVQMKEDDKRWVIFPWEGGADKLNIRQSVEGD